MRNHSRIYIITAISILFLLNLFLPSSGFAVNSDSHDTLVLLGNEKMAPIVYNDNGTGLVVDIAEAIGDKIGCEIEVMAINWEQAQMMVLNGEADGLLQINPSPERNKVYDFSSPLLRSDFSIFVQSDNMTLKTIDDLRDKHVGAEAAGYPRTLLQEYDTVNIEIILDWESSFRDLSEGKLDAIIVDRWIGEYELARSRIDGIKIVENPVEISPYKLIATPEKMRQTFEGGENFNGEVVWKIPKFGFGSKLTLTSVLKSLGVNSAFALDADFSGITDHMAFITDVRQDTHIAIDEDGVEAAAFTQIAYAGAALPEGRAEMILDRPFIYGITTQNGTLLFAGVCENPAET